MRFLGLIYSNNLKSVSSSITYFLVQALAGIVLIMRIFWIGLDMSTGSHTIFLAALLAKLGAAPFHYWYLSILPKLAWRHIWVISIWQKLLPLILLATINPGFLTLIGLVNASLASLSILRAKKLKRLLSLSSVFNLGWAIIRINYTSHLWLLYMLIYGLSLIPLIFFFKNTTSIKPGLNYVNYRLFFISFIIIGGIPPFPIFFIKVTVIAAVSASLHLVGLALILLALFTLYAYLSVIFISLTLGQPLTQADFAKRYNFFSFTLLRIFLTGFANNFYCVIHKYK